jgi:hypothetical protein
MHAEVGAASAETSHPPVFGSDAGRVVIHRRELELVAARRALAGGDLP